MCAPKDRSGKVEASEAMVKQFHGGPESRNMLIKVFLDCGGDKVHGSFRGLQHMTYNSCAMYF